MNLQTRKYFLAVSKVQEQLGSRCGQSRNRGTVQLQQCQFKKKKKKISNSQTAISLLVLENLAASSSSMPISTGIAAAICRRDCTNRNVFSSPACEFMNLQSCFGKDVPTVILAFAVGPFLESRV